MLGVMEMKVVDGQDCSGVILITLLYFLLVRLRCSPPKATRSQMRLTSRVAPDCGGHRGKD